jgi:transmembrane sensor
MSDITALLLDYVSDALPSEARASLEARLVADPVFRARAEPLLAAWRAGPRAVEDRAAGEALRRAIAVRERRPVGVIAVGLAAVFVGAFLGVYGPGVYRIVAPVVAAHQDIGYATDVGERRTVRLPDGSRATLWPESRLHYRASFFRAVPDVVVSGEVDFDAVHALSVRAGAARVSGGMGHFLVAGYAGDADIRVSAFDSSVHVNGWSVIAGTTLYVTDTAVVFRRTDDNGVVSWEGDQLRLVGVPFADAVRVMRRWYGVDIRAGDARLLGTTVTATLPVGVKGAVAALGGRAVWRGDTVTVYEGP